MATLAKNLRNRHLGRTVRIEETEAVMGAYGTLVKAEPYLHLSAVWFEILDDDGYRATIYKNDEVIFVKEKKNASS